MLTTFLVLVLAGHCNTDCPVIQCLYDWDCDDGSFCNGPEECRNTVCAPSRSNPCTLEEACLEETDECVSDDDAQEFLPDEIGEGEGEANIGEGEGESLSSGEGEGEGEGENSSNDDGNVTNSDGGTYLSGSAVGGCSTAGSFPMIVVLACLLVFRFRKMVFAAILIAAGSASAEGLDGFRFAEGAGAIGTVPGTSTLRQWQGSASLGGDWASNTLTIRNEAGAKIVNVIENDLTGKLGLTLGVLEGIDLSLQFPVTSLSDPTRTLTSFEDPRVSAKFTVVEVDNAALAFRISTDVPGAAFQTVSHRLFGELGINATPDLIASLNFSPLQLNARIGHTFRTVPQDIIGFQQSNEVLADLGAAFSLTSFLSVFGTVGGSISYFGDTTAFIETSGGVNLLVGNAKITGLVGTSLLPGIGSPETRIGLNLSVPFGAPEPNGCPDCNCDPVPETSFNAATLLAEDAGPAGLAKIVDNEIIILMPIYFAFDKSDILPQSLPVLDDIAAILHRHPDILLVSAEGHTDSFGSANYNDKLSDRRMESVIDYLHAAGIEEHRLVGEGWGESQPVAPNDTLAGRDLNRRVEFKILSRQN